jgi:catecholate siderophore receptor
MATGIGSAPLSSRHMLASAVGLAVAAQGGFSYAAETAADDGTGAIQLGATSIEGQAQSVYNPVAPSSPKYTEPLRDTPQTITVVPKEVIHDQNLLTLRDVLSTVPGITFGAGEGGSGYGDSINLRGFSASGDIYVDGVRDSAQYSRTDPFNLEQVEVVSGASSVYSGSGAVGGTINLVTKTPELRDKTTISAGIGTDNYKRTTLDTNQTINDTTAFRLNLMAHGNDVPGRDYEDYERWGIAPSIAFGLGTPTRVTVSYEHQKDDNTPQYGVPIYNGKLMPGVGWSDYYGYHNINEQKITSDAFSLKLEHDFNDAVSIRNFSRVERVRQDLRASGPEGAQAGCLASGTQITGAPCTAGLAPGYFQPSGGSLGNERSTQNKIFTNQTDVTSHFSTGFIDHTLVTGIAISREEYEADTGNWLRNSDGSTITPPPVSYSDPDSHWSGPVNFTRAAHIDGELNNRAAYAFDTLKLSPQWEINGGLRYEHNAGSSVTNAYSSTGVETPGTRYGQSDDLTSYRLALVYKPAENGSIYIAYGNSKTPSQASVNGSCYTAGRGSTPSSNNCDVDPEKSLSYEIGTKWDLLDNALSLTGSIFRNDRTNYKVASNDPSDLSGTQTLNGKARVDGVALGLTGAITDHWKVYANYTYLDSKVLQSVSNFTKDTTGIDAQKGEPLTFTPKHAASLWTVYDLAHGFQVGYGLTIQSKQYLASAAGAPTAPGYTVQRAMLGYKVNKELNLQLNVNNLFNKEYLTRIRNNGWAEPGDGRVAIVSADYSF